MAPRATSVVNRSLAELGLLSLYKSCKDTKILCLQRFVRLFAYGGSTLVLASYLSELGNSDSRIGLFMTLTLIGDVLISFCLTLFADALGRKAILGAGALLMTFSGITFALSGNFWILVAAAILGVISPSGNEIGPFKAIEESTLAQLTPTDMRSDIYAWYTLIGTAGIAFGIMTCGWVVHALQDNHGWTNIQTYHLVFQVYAIFGLVKFGLALALSKNVEAEKKREEHPATTELDSARPFLDEEHEDEDDDVPVFVKPMKKKKSWTSMLPDISRESRVIVINLCLLFALDSFASGLVPISWVTYFFKRKFDMDEGKLGSLFFTSSIIAAMSTLVASSISKRFGNIKTMVFTHLPSAVALSLIPLPSTPGPAMMFLILRACTQSMDSAPRSAFLAAVVLPAERTAVMGVINVVKTFSQSMGPFITGLLASKQLFWVAFVAAGMMKASYDLGLLAVFAGHKTREEQAAETAAAKNNMNNIDEEDV